MKRSLRSKIITWSFVPTAIILVSVGLVSVYAYQRVAENLVMERDRELTRLSATLLATELATYIDADPMQDQYLPIFDGVVVFGPDGTILASETERYEGWRPNWYDEVFGQRDPQGDELMFSNVVVDGLQNEKMVVVVLPVVKPGDQIGGIAGLFHLDPARGNTLFQAVEGLRRGEENRVFLVDGTGQVIYHPDRDRIGQDFSAQPAVQRVLRGEVAAIRTDDIGGQDIVASFAPVPGTAWGLVTEESWAALTQASRRFGNYLLGLLALGVIVPTLIVTTGVRRITDPITNLITAAQRMAKGDFEHRIEATTGDELEELGEQFNRMAGQLQASYAFLERKVADRTKELATLNAIAAEVSQSLDLKEILDNALDEVLDVTGMERGQAFRLDEDRGMLVQMAQRGFRPEAGGRGTSLALDASVAGQAMQAGQPVVQDLAEDMPDADEGAQLVIGVPLIAQGRKVGAITLSTKARREIATEEIALLAAIGHQIGVAVENARLFEKAQQLAVVRERNRLAGDLHDSVTQALYGVTLCAEAAARELGVGGIETAADYLRAIQGTTLEALREMRLLIFELRPPTLSEDGLAGALRARLEAVEERLGVQTELEVEGEGPLPREMEAALYRITQEALNNALKHSQAAWVRVRMRQHGHDVAVEVVDDGIGFDPEAVRGQGGFGLRGLEERVAALDGTLAVLSSPGHGTTIRVEVCQ
jgi:nitrate/nitrite-specific signal transduction histidine kinase